MTTKQDVKTALDAWYAARDQAALEHEAWGTLLQSQQALIDSLRANGVPFTKAKSDVEKYSKTHNQALLAALKSMDERCAEYYALAQKYEAQHGHKP